MKFTKAKYGGFCAPSGRLAGLAFLGLSLVLARQAQAQFQLQPNSSGSIIASTQFFNAAVGGAPQFAPNGELVTPGGNYADFTGASTTLGTVNTPPPPASLATGLALTLQPVGSQLIYGNMSMSASNNGISVGSNGLIDSGVLGSGAFLDALGSADYKWIGPAQNVRVGVALGVFGALQGQNNQAAASIWGQFYQNGVLVSTNTVTIASGLGLNGAGNLKGFTVSSNPADITAYAAGGLSFAGSGVSSVVLPLKTNDIVHLDLTLTFMADPNTSFDIEAVPMTDNPPAFGDESTDTAPAMPVWAVGCLGMTMVLAGQRACARRWPIPPAAA